mgnify:CR=1 FL=1|jgi:hypothetical protein
MSIRYPNNANKWPLVKVYGLDFRTNLLDMAKTTTRLKLWNWFKNESPPKNEGYQFWDDENINKISDGLENNNHSGATFGYCMRQIQFIAKNGFDEYNKYNMPN